MQLRGLSINQISLSAVLVVACGASRHAGDAGSMDTAGFDDGSVSSPVTMRNLSATIRGQNVMCATNDSPTLVACPEYEFRLVLRNDGNKAIAVLDYLRLAFDSQELFNQTGGLCTLPPWTLPPGGDSELITVRFSYTGEAPYKPRFYYSCGLNSTEAYAPGPYARGATLPSLPTGGLVTLKVQGIFSDGSPFLAAAQTALNP